MSAPVVPLRAIAPRHLASIGQTFLVDHPWPGLVVLVVVAVARPSSPSRGSSGAHSLAASPGRVARGRGYGRPA